MKKRTVCFLMATLLLLCTCSCHKSSENIYGLLEHLCDLFEEERGVAILYSDTETDGFILADGETLGRLYDGKWEEPGCMSRIECYAIRLPLDDSGFEIHILKCRALSDTAEVSMLIQRRIDRLQNAEIKEYAPEDYEKYFIGAELYVKGDTVFLLATPDNLAVKKAIKRW